MKAQDNHSNVVWEPALDALRLIVSRIEGTPTYAQVQEVLDCMREFAEEFCTMTALQKPDFIIRGHKCGRNENGVFHCECGKCTSIKP